MLIRLANKLSYKRDSLHTRFSCLALYLKKNLLFAFAKHRLGIRFANRKRLKLTIHTIRFLISRIILVKYYLTRI